VPLRRSVPLPRGQPPQRIVPVRKMRSGPRWGPDRSPEYLAWIRTLGCVVCSRVSGGATAVEAAHTNVLGPRGIGQKTSDFSAIPLCSGHHRDKPDSYHVLGEQVFFAQAWHRTERDRASIARAILAAIPVRTPRRSSGGGGVTIPATSAGERGALEEGVWGRNLVKVSPPLARRHQIPHPPPPLRAPDISRLLRQRGQSESRDAAATVWVTHPLACKETTRQSRMRNGRTG
jgi:hypothetical protein